MFDIEKQVQLWHQDADRSWEDAQYLLAGKRMSMGLFALHLALEKALKACLIRQKREMPPRIHNLVSLARLAALTLSPDQEKVLAELNIFNIRGRYPGAPGPEISVMEAESIVERAREVYLWLIKQL